MNQTPKQLRANQNILEMEYAVRGPIAQRAAVLQNQGREIIPCHIGNPQALGQKPLTYLRQVLSLTETPALIDRERKLRQMVDKAGKSLPGVDLFPEDILQLSERILEKSKTGMGAYTESKGFKFVREAIADFINRRDGFLGGNELQANPERIFLTNGASQGVSAIVDLLISGKNDGIMIPIPQYPLYSATIKKAGGAQINYYPNEESGWVFDRSVLEESYIKAVKTGLSPKAIVVINPGNPTGAVLTEDCMQEVVEFAKDHNLVIIADEVYQDNIYQGKFISFAKAVGSTPVVLVSLHSISKGFYGECGHRGGYFEIRNPPMIAGTNLTMVDILNKQASVNLCSNTPGQILTYLMVSPPVEGSQIHVNYNQEKEFILGDLYKKAVTIRDAFEEMVGVECYGETGALYLFPKLTALPEGTTDFDYCMALLEETGLCTVNGSGFGQKENTHHLRIAFLPPEETLLQMLPDWIKFHHEYINK